MRFDLTDDEEGGLAEINITPLVDVSMVLLIIFMITAPMLMQGANVQLPQTRPISRLPSGNVFLTVTADGQIFLNDDKTPIELDDLAERLAPYADLEEAVYVQGDRSAVYGRVVEVLAAAHEAGIENVALITEVARENSRR